MQNSAVQRSQDLPAAPGSDVDTTALLMRRLHVELAELAKGVLATQHALGPMLSQLPTMTSEAMEEAQRLDLIEQSLRDLATVTAHAADSMGDPLDLDALTKVCLLSNIAARLRGDPVDDMESADLDLF